jgi:predicted metal-dependent hydrolase
MTTINFGELSFELRESSRRRTIEITIERDGSLVLATPPKVPREDLENIVNRNRFKIYNQLIKKESFKTPEGTKTYLPGEGFYYLGRSHLLKLVDTAKVPLTLSQSRFELLRSRQGDGRDLFIQWYRTHLNTHLEPIVYSFANRVGANPKSVQIRELGNRWGSCNPKGDLYFHWRVALLPRIMMEYLVVHEMIHLVQPNHNRDFWDRVARIIPDWCDRKEWLAKNGALYDL